MFPKELKALIESYKQVFNTTDGKKVLEDLEKRFFMHSSIFSVDPYETAYREGCRSVILTIKKLIQGVKDDRREPGSE
jgi:hypothetical protein